MPRTIGDGRIVRISCSRSRVSRLRLFYENGRGDENAAIVDLEQEVDSRPCHDCFALIDC